LRTPALVIAATVVALVLGSGCGVDESQQGPPFHPGNIDSPRSLLVSGEDVEGIGADSPYGAILGWWRALQRGDVAALKRSYVEPITTAKARRQIHAFEPRLSQPVVPDEEEGRNRATVELLVRAAVRLGDMPNVISVHDVPTTFELERKGSEWRLRNNAYAAYRRALLDDLAEDF
jgi:hypothetical protein